MAVSKESFVKEHYDWIVAGVGLAALVGSVVFFVMSSGEADTQAYISSRQANFAMLDKKSKGVELVDMTILNKATRSLKKPASLNPVDAKKGNFLVSERRVFCQAGAEEDKSKACGRPIQDGLKECPYCGVKQHFERVQIDNDGDGLPNDWEKKYGLNIADPADANIDSDNDGFTNTEEFKAGTDPKDASSHPDYLDSLSVASALKQTMLPFWFREANPIPDGKGGTTYRLTFQRINVKNRYDAILRIKVGEAIRSDNGKIDTGFVVKEYKKKTEKQLIAGSKLKQSKVVDVSTVTLERTSDKKTLEIRIGQRDVPVEAQVDLVYNRNESTNMTVSVGSEITLNGQKYKITNLKQAGNSCEVTITDSKGNKKIIQ
jgi:hypothetical protein